MWEDQHKRVTRYLERLRTQQNYKVFYGSVPTEFIDDIYTSIQHLHHLKDWLISSGKISKQDANKLIESSSELKLVQDICNGTKHLTTEFREGGVSIVVKLEESYVTKGYAHEKRARYFVSHQGKEEELISLLETSLYQWEKFLKQRGILQ